jgi:hypothetical protein
LDNLRTELKIVYGKKINEEEKTKKKKHKLESQKKQLELLMKFENDYGIYRAYKNVICKKKRDLKLKEEKLKEREERKRRYKILETPQKLFEGIALSGVPLFFFCLLITFVFYPIFLDKLIPNTIPTLIFILAPFSFATVILFASTLCIAFLADFLRSVRMGTKLETLSALFFLGNLWIPILPFLFLLKIVILEENSSWRAVLSPSWVISFVFSFLTLFLPKRLKMQWGLAHQLLWGFNLGVNLVVCVTTGLLSAKLDGTLPATLGFSYFVFLPVWFGFFFCFVGIGIGFVYCLHK